MKVAPVLNNIYSLSIMAGLLRAANRRYEAFLCALEEPSVREFGGLRRRDGAGWRSEEVSDVLIREVIC